MLHSDLCSRQIGSASKITSRQFRPVNRFDAHKLAIALEDDAASLAQSSVASLFEGISNVAGGRNTWATVKLYYSAFYACRALLMLRKVSIFYLGKSPHSLIAKEGEIVQKEGGNSHTLTFAKFSQQFAADPLLSQEIELMQPLDWIEEKRNLASYKTAPFPDPEAGWLFGKPSMQLRSYISQYINCDLTMYVFDPNHSMIAYPIKIILRLNDELDLSGQDRVIVSKHFIDILSNTSCFVPEFKNRMTSYAFS